MKNEVMDWVIKHFGEDLVIISPDICAKVSGISRRYNNGKEVLLITHASGNVKFDDTDVVRTVDTDDYMFRIKHTGSWYCLVTEAYCKKKEAEGILAHDIVGEILESIAEPASMEDDAHVPEIYTVTDKFGVERETIVIDTENKVISQYLEDMKNTPLGMVFAYNTISEANSGVVGHKEDDKPQIESMVVLSMDAPCPDIVEGCPLLMGIGEEDKAVIGQTPWKKDGAAVCYVMSNICRGIIFPYLDYPFEQMEALVQKFDRCAAMFREEVDTDSLGNKSDKTEPDVPKVHTVVDKFGVERETLYIDAHNEVISQYLADMKNIPLGMVYTFNTISEVNHNHAVYDGVVEYVESNDKPQIKSNVVLSVDSRRSDLEEGYPLIMDIDEKDKAVVGQTPWKKDDIPVCYVMSDNCRGIIFPYLVYSFDQMEALVQNYDRCAAMFRKDVDTKGLGNKYDNDVEKSVMDMLEEKYQFPNGVLFHDKNEKKDEIEISEEEISEEEEDDVCEEHLFRQMAEYIQDNEISSITFTLNEDGTVHCETLLRAVYPTKN